MKKILALGFLLAVTTPYLQAGEARFTAGVGLAGAPSLDGFGVYSGGGGIDGNIGFTFGDHFALLLAIDSIVFPHPDFSDVRLGEVNLFPSVRYAFGDSNVRPFLIGGPGLNTEIFTVGNSSQTFRSFAFHLGGGMLIDLSQAVDLYIQARFVNVMADGFSYSFLPVSVGVQFK